jgi:hypothetical protein
MKSMGDLNNGTFPVQLSFENVTVNPTDTVVMNYLIVNSGHKDPSEVESILEGAGVELLTLAGKTLGAALSSLLPIPDLGQGLGAFATWIGGKLVALLNANCDGPVAAEQNTCTYADLTAKMANGPFTQRTKHPGTNSPSGCGSNSVYYVNWHMVEIGASNNKTVPDVVGMATDTPGSIPAHEFAVATLQAAGLRATFEQGTKGPKVVRQSPPADAVVDVGSSVTLWRGTIVP